jgi:DNA-binding transcriptional regulator YdaS (Cro superfamily)
MDAIDRLAAHLSRREATEPGQQTRLANHLKVSQGLVWQWLNRRCPIAPKHARGIEEYTGNDVSRFEIAPQVFGPRPLGSITDEDHQELLEKISLGPEVALPFIKALSAKYELSLIDQLVERAKLTTPGAEQR